MYKAYHISLFQIHLFPRIPIYAAGSSKRCRGDDMFAAAKRFADLVVRIARRIRWSCSRLAEQLSLGFGAARSGPARRAKLSSAQLGPEGEVERLGLLITPGWRNRLVDWIGLRGAYAETEVLQKQEVEYSYSLQENMLRMQIL